MARLEVKCTEQDHAQAPREKWRSSRKSTGSRRATSARCAAMRTCCASGATRRTQHERTQHERGRWAVPPNDQEPAARVIEAAMSERELQRLG